MDISSLTIDEAKEIAAMFGQQSASAHPSYNQLAPEGGIVIAVLQRGHVVVGTYSQHDVIGRLEKASVVRRWGTEQGLGELAMKGPLPQSAPNGPTQMDKCPDVTFHIREAVMIMEVNTNAWRNIMD